MKIYIYMSCTICLEEYKNPRKTQCGHVFCRTCIHNWINEEDYYGCKKRSCPLCRDNIGVLTRVNIKMKNKITKKKEPIKRVYRTRYKIAEERIQSILNEYANENFTFGSVEELWEMAQKVSKEGKNYLCHNKSMREIFNRKMKEFAKHDEKFLTLIKK